MQCGYQLGSVAAVDQYLSERLVGPITTHTVNVAEGVDVNSSTGHSRNRHAWFEETGQ